MIGKIEVLYHKLILMNFFLFRTKLIEDSRRPQPRYRGLIHGSAQIIRDEGLGGIYRGLLPVVSFDMRYVCWLRHLRAED